VTVPIGHGRLRSNRMGFSNDVEEEDLIASVPRTIWSLSNAFTSAFKQLDPHTAVQGDNEAPDISGGYIPFYCLHARLPALHYAGRCGNIDRTFSAANSLKTRTGRGV
jgi:hypothetical protein